MELTILNKVGAFDGQVMGSNLPLCLCRQACAGPALAGRYVYGDFCSGRIFTLDAESPGEPREESVVVEQLTSFGRDADGRTLLVSGDGRILRLAG